MENKKICAICGQILKSEDDVIYHEGQTFCEDCFEETFACCECCDEVIPRDSLVEVLDRWHDFVNYCPDCVARFCETCVECGEIVVEDNITRYFDGCQDVCVCNDCFEDHYTTCEHCGQVMHNDDAEYCEEHELTLCSDCYDEHIEDKHNSSNIAGYHCSSRRKRELQFHGIGSRFDVPHLGFELEIDKGGCDGKSAERILCASGHDTDDFYICEKDASLDDGFEIISEPATLAWHKKNAGIEELCAEARRLGYVSHDANTCGLHVHIDRTYLSNNLRVDNGVMDRRMIIMLQNNRKWFETFSRRTYWHYCTPFGRMNASKYGPFTSSMFEGDTVSGKEHDPWEIHDILDDMRDHSRDHYTAINLATGYDTVEVRINRGTLKPSTIIAVLQQCDLIARIVRNNTCEEMCNVNFNTFKELAEELEYQEFLDYCNHKGITA